MMTASSSFPATVPAPSEVSPWWLLTILLRRRRFLYACLGVGLLVGASAALLRPRTYTTTFSFLPKNGQDASRAAGLAGLAGQFGINLGSLGGDAEPPQLYADLLVSREVLAPIAMDSVPMGEAGTALPLADFLRISGDTPPLRVENTMRALRRRVVSTTVATRTTGMVTVRVRTRVPEASLAIAESLLAGLNHFNLVTRQSSAREERRFTEARLEEARAALRVAEDAQQRFLQSNRAIDGSPSLRFENDRLTRQVQLQQQIVTSLTQQYEENRIREVRDTPVLTVFERPALAARPDPGMRAVLLALSLLAGLLVGILVVLSRDLWARESASGDDALAAFRAEWAQFRGRAAT
jgi:uncharacterized protein involved in exopolysaccharide biosynthesis